jgi:hypothetical protein
MAIEKSLSAVPPQLLTSDGQSNGLVTIPDSTLFKVKQIVTVVGAPSGSVQLEIKRIDTATTMLLGPTNSNINSRYDLSAFTTTLSSFLFADEQQRKQLPEQDIVKAIYEAEPTVAVRTFQVDKMGNSYGTPSNPINIVGSVSTSGGLVFDDILLTRDSDGDITKAVYKLAAVPVLTYDLFYDANKDLIEVVKT